MRTIIYTDNGGPDVLRLVDRDIPVPGPGEVRVRVVSPSMTVTKVDGVGAVHSATLRTRDHASSGTEIDLAYGLGEVRRFIPVRRDDEEIDSDSAKRTERTQLLIRAEHVFRSQRQSGDRVETPDVDYVGALP